MIFDFFLNLFKKEPKQGCPNCYKEEIVSFGKDLLYNKFISMIEEEELIGKTQIFECRKCATKFFINANMYEKIFSGQIEFLREWDKKSLICPSELKNELDIIGFSKDWKSNANAPCEVQLKNGERHDLSVVKFSNDPPLGYFYNSFKNIFFIDDVEAIISSKYGLSNKIRITSGKAPERRMGFYPTVVKTFDSKFAVVNGISLFFKSENIIGSQLTLANEEWDHRKKYAYDSLAHSEETLIIAKQ